MLARRLSRSLDQLRRDLRTVGRRLAGHGPPPLVRGSGGRAHAVRRPHASELQVHAGGARGARGNARELVAERLVRETPEAVTLVLRDPRGEVFRFVPGQFFTLLTTVDGEVVPRNYSASNAPGTEELHLTIKIKAGGKVSPLLGRIQPGDRLNVLGPFGSFVVPPAEPGSSRRLVLVLIAGGAGITPLASIARTLLASEPGAELAIVHANRREEDIILAAQLASLAAAHESRLTLLHVLEEAPAAWRGPGRGAGLVGRLDRVTAARALAELPLASHPEARFYVCGPDGMRDEVLVALAERGVDESAIMIERFSIGPRPHAVTSSATIAASVAPGARPVAIRVKDRTHRTVALPGATVLEAGLAAGAPMPFSCAVGGCGACRVKLVEGDVELEEPNCLSDAERAAGYVLACVGRPCGPCVIEVPEQT